MARRPGGKAASRKARQRRPQRPAASVPPTPSAPPLDVQMVEPRASAVDESPAFTPRRMSAPSAERALSGTGSSLTAHDRAEYHYVERDLRNIGILTVVMLVLLVAAWAAFTVLGIVG